MRRSAPYFGITFFLAGLLFLVSVVPEAEAQALRVRPAEPVCELPKGAFEGRRIMAAPTFAKRQKSATITINFLTSGSVFDKSCNSSWPQGAQNALRRAADTWEGLLDSPVPIEMDACWTSELGPNTLGSAGPFLIRSDAFPGRPRR